jgi:CheY-like chemotaxis protein
MDEVFSPGRTSEVSLMNGRVPIVLLIEHDAIQRGTLARLLKAAGYCVIPAGRAHEALETFATHHVDIALVVADTQTQSLSGPPLLGSLVAIDALVPVIALSAGVATNDRPAYEYPNVAATLMRPFEPSDVLHHVERVFRSASGPVAQAVVQVPTSARPVIFNWPPTEEELADIQVIDTRTWEGVQALLAPLAPPQALVKPTSAPLIEVDELPNIDEFAQTTEVVVAPPPPRLLIRGLERRPRFHEYRLSPRVRRTLSVAATVCCGLALTTLLELRSVPRQDARVDQSTRDIANPRLLSASHLPVGAMPLVSARRVVPRSTADIINRRPAPPSVADAPANASMPVARAVQPNDRSATTRIDTTPPPVAVADNRRLAESMRDVASGDARVAADAVAAPPASTTLAPPPAAPAPEPPPPLDRAPAREAVMAANVPAPLPASAVGRGRDDERGIYQVLEQYERAYERLDVNAARAVWPSLNTRALTRAFDGLKAQALEFSNCRVAMEPREAEATAVCGGSASYVPRVGRQAARTESREWTFHLRKIDQDWLIAKAEVK